MMRLKTIGRKSGRERAAILGYYEDGPNLVTMAMNGWGEPEPAWWLNLQAHPDTTVELHDRTIAVRGRAATAEERPRLWELWGRYDGPDDLEAWASRRPARDRGRHPRATGGLPWIDAVAQPVRARIRYQPGMEVVRPFDAGLRPGAGRPDRLDRKVRSADQ